MATCGTPAPIAEGREHVNHLCVIRTEIRDALLRHLKARGVATVLTYPKALPVYPEMTEGKIQSVVGSIRAFIRT